MKIIKGSVWSSQRNESGPKRLIVVIDTAPGFIEIQNVTTGRKTQVRRDIFKRIYKFVSHKMPEGMEITVESEAICRSAPDKGFKTRELLALFGEKYGLTPGRLNYDIHTEAIKPVLKALKLPVASVSGANFRKKLMDANSKNNPIRTLIITVTVFINNSFFD